jgi:23S rRNA (cytidine1920-2'-O)/16S rRNA (cytidine1409-2'-O)-methyltransferase
MTDKKGIIRDKKVHKKIATKIIDDINTLGMEVFGLTWSPIKGSDGNIEFLVWFGNRRVLMEAKTFKGASVVHQGVINVDLTVESAFLILN